MCVFAATLTSWSLNLYGTDTDPLRDVSEQHRPKGSMHTYRISSSAGGGLSVSHIAPLVVCLSVTVFIYVYAT